MSEYCDVFNCHEKATEFCPKHKRWTCKRHACNKTDLERIKAEIGEEEEFEMMEREEAKK